MRITIKNLQRKIPVNPRRVKAAILGLLLKEGIKSAEIAVLFTTAARIRGLNRRYHHRDRATDVLAFDLGSGQARHISGDIAVSADAAVQNAKTYRTSGQYELYLYVLHGLLHLLGYEDRTAKQRRAINAKAEEMMTNIG